MGPELASAGPEDAERESASAVCCGRGGSPVHAQCKQNWGLLSVNWLPGLSARCFSTGAVMWKWTVIGWMLLGLCVAAPPQHINRLALFPDKSAWCEAKNITQIIGHTGCQPQSIQNRACLGQCFSYSVPNTIPQLTESLVHCDSCMPAQIQWEVVTLECPGNKEMSRVDKLVERILHCSCQSCIKEMGQEGALLQLFPSETTPEPPAQSEESHPHIHPDTHAQHAHAHTDSHPHKPAEG
ncbi:hypothetical protein AAFF_G00035880 [Aldrovandia affinis]|uniref:CTCK domain-containing protein n=1 Tax=Aldrovandia affinis TaxID=143900 RepID=A0AAD7S362_9TELE|nr:hypothetical protein AAFF_G00035880 [Aldrovandia affinis]